MDVDRGDDGGMGGAGGSSGEERWGVDKRSGAKRVLLDPLPPSILVLH